uniref:Uncharacterized protein n=1 Tax=Cucumis melo TaxID=3656 RepID=A0A9I9E5J3_CUCME
MLKYLLRDKSANSIRGNTYPQVPPCHRGPTSPFPKDSLRFAPQAFSLAVEIFLYLLHCISLIGYRTSNVHWQTYHGDCNYFFTQSWHIRCRSDSEWIKTYWPIPNISKELENYKTWKWSWLVKEKQHHDSLRVGMEDLNVCQCIYSQERKDVESFFSRGRGRSWSKGGVCGAELGRKNRERGAEEQEQGTVWSENRAKAWSGS